MLFILLLVAIIVGILLTGFEIDKRDTDTKEWKDYVETTNFYEQGYSKRDELREAFTGVESVVVKKLKYDIDNVFDDYDIGFRGGLMIFTVIVLAIALVFVACAQIGKESAYLQYQNERTVLLVQYERLDSENPNLAVNGDLGSLSDVYDDIIEYNNVIIRANYWSDNLWFNWFWNPRLADLEPIVVE